MKILRLSTFLDYGGLETRLATISQVQDEHEWTFVCLNNAGEAARIIQQNQKEVINLKVKPSVYSFKTLIAVYKILKKTKPDVIHTSGAEANFHGILAAKLAGIPRIIGEEIGIPQHSKKARLIFALLYKMVDFVVVNSQSVLDAVQRIDKVPQHKLIQINNPVSFVDLTQYPRKTHSPSFKILMISRLEPVKNIDGVLNVLYTLKNKTEFNFKLRIAGDGSLEKHLKQKTKDLNLEEEVEFLGIIHDPYLYLMNADLFLLNSHSEGFSNSLVEAMYSKTPALSTSVGVAPEIIRDEDNGFLIPKADEEALYQKLINIFQMTEKELKKVGLKGHQNIINNFSLEKHVAALMNIYNYS